MLCEGGPALTHTLLADGLVDELHLFVFPVALGAGEKLFQDDGSQTKLALAASRAYDNGVLHLTYGPAS